MKNICVCGYGFTGSAAICDLFREYNEISVLDNKELTIIYDVDGLEDLYYQLCLRVSRFGSDAAIKRFRQFIINHSKLRYSNHSFNKALLEITDLFLSRITEVSWKGYWHFDNMHANYLKRNFKQRFLYKIFDDIFKWNPFVTEQMYFSHIAPEQFIKEAKEYMGQVIQLLNPTKDIVLLDQSLSGNNPLAGMMFLQNPYAIIVTRDPRDLYVLAKFQIIHQGRFIPTDNVENFINYYKRLMETTIVKYEEKVCFIKFEDLIYKYDDTLVVLESFTKLKNHKSPGTIFKPEISIKNTQLYKKYNVNPSDINLIEKNLPSYLYEFPSQC